MNAKKHGLFSAELLSNESLSPTCRLLVFKRPVGFPHARPGQFVSVRASAASVPLLRRPYSLVDCTEREIALLVKVVGIGSSMIGSRQPGDTIDVMGPLGGSWFTPPEGGNALFVAGGTGLAPIVFASRSWRREGLLGDCMLLYGAANRNEILERLVADDFPGYRLATLDGSVGFDGDVVSLCEQLLDSGALTAGTLYSCGPRAMVEALVTRVERRFKVHYTSLESVMACGLGACRGCTVPVTTPNGIELRSVCSDGTVFRAGDVSWEVWVD